MGTTPPPRPPRQPRQVVHECDYCRAAIVDARTICGNCGAQLPARKFQPRSQEERMRANTVEKRPNEPVKWRLE